MTRDGKPAGSAAETVSPGNADNAPSLPSPSPALRREEAWFCVRSQQKREHIAAANLRRHLGIDVFNPRLRYRKATRRGLVWTPEPVFPGYVFARFDLTSQLERVQFTAGVSSLVRFGTKTPVIADEVISDLRKHFPPDGVHQIDDTLQEQQEVTIGFGRFAGLKAVVLRTLSATRRVQVLLEFLGYTAKLDLPREHLVVPRRYSKLAVGTHKG